jgi:hypothetical protein
MKIRKEIILKIFRLFAMISSKLGLWWSNECKFKVLIEGIHLSCLLMSYGSDWFCICLNYHHLWLIYWKYFISTVFLCQNVNGRINCREKWEDWIFIIDIIKRDFLTIIYDITRAIFCHLSIHSIDPCYSLVCQSWAHIARLFSLNVVGIY